MAPKEDAPKRSPPELGEEVDRSLKKKNKRRKRGKDREDHGVGTQSRGGESPSPVPDETSEERMRREQVSSCPERSEVCKCLMQQSRSERHV